MADAEIEALERKRDSIKKEMVAVGDMRQGTLSERYRRCGKPRCRCAKKGARGHGPSWSLTRAVGGKTVTTIIPAESAEQTRRDIAEFKRFRGLAKELVDVSEQLCDARIDASVQAASTEAAKKRGSKKPLRRNSSRKSTRS